MAGARGAWAGAAAPSLYGRGPWVVPGRPRYPYVRPVSGYRPNKNVVAPRRTNVNINVDNSRTNVNVGNKVNTGDRNYNNRNASSKNTSNRNTNVSKGTVDRTPNASNRAATPSRRPTGRRAPPTGRAAQAPARPVGRPWARERQRQDDQVRPEDQQERHVRLFERVEHQVGEQPWQVLRLEEQGWRRAKDDEPGERVNREETSYANHLVAGDRAPGERDHALELSPAFQIQDSRFSTALMPPRKRSHAPLSAPTRALLDIMGPDSRALILPADQVQAAPRPAGRQSSTGGKVVARGRRRFRAHDRDG